MTDSADTRYTSRAFPDYRHVPGRTPHPTRDAAGHSFGRSESTAQDLNRDAWRSNDDFLYGVDLFNAAYWWECHEVFECLWHAAGLGTPAGHALQAMIQCAAAHLKTESSQPVGAARLLEHARRHVDWAGGRRLGVDLASLADDTLAYMRGSGVPARIVLCVGPPLCR